MDSTRHRDEPLGPAVVRAIASAKGVDPVSLPPLTDTLDPDALDALFGGRERSEAHGPRHLLFRYADAFVSIRSDDGTPSISVTLASETNRPKGVGGTSSDRV